MKDSISSLLASLNDKRLQLEAERANLEHKMTNLRRARVSAACECLEELLPDLEMKTIEVLWRQAPNFEVSTVYSSWLGWLLGFGRKVAPDVSLDSLRIKLGTYLDSIDEGWPKIWENRVVRAIDQSILLLQTDLALKGNQLAETNAQINALEKLTSVDVEKMPPQLRRKLEEAVTEKARRESRADSNKSSLTPDSDDTGPVELWLWLQLLTPDSTYAQEVARTEDGGGNFGGGGADGSWGTSDSSVEAPDPNDTSNLTQEDQLAAHANLGSQTFS